MVFRPLTLIAGILALGCGVLLAQHLGTSRRPISPAMVASQSENPTGSSEGEEADSQPERVFRGNVRHLLEEEDLEHLESIAAEVRTEKPRFRGGGWKLKAFYAVIEN